MGTVEREEGLDEEWEEDGNRRHHAASVQNEGEGFGFPGQPRGPGVEWSTGRARRSPGAAARARGGGECSRLVLPLRCLAIQQPDFPEMMRQLRPMGARERPGGGVAESRPGNPAKCLDFFSAPRTRQCAPLLRRGRTCSRTPEPSRAEPRTGPSRAEVCRDQRLPHPRHRRHLSLRARVQCLHRNPLPRSPVPSADRSCCKGEPAGAAAGTDGRRETKGARDTRKWGPGTPWAGVARELGRALRASGRAGGRRAAACTAPWPLSAVCVRGAAAGPLGGPERPSRASASSAGGFGRPPARTFGGRSPALELRVSASTSARWQRLVRCPEWLDPVVDYRGFRRRCHRCRLRHFSAAEETRPEGVAPQPITLWALAAGGDLDWIGGGGGGEVPGMEGDLLAWPGRHRAGDDNKQKFQR